MRVESQVKEKRSRSSGIEKGKARNSAAQFGFHHVDDGVLLGDHLGLPNQGDNQKAHGEDTDG
jgi:hypothetical protein